MGLTVRTDLEFSKNRLPVMDSVMREAMVPATREAMQEAHSAAEERVARQDIPGPPLSAFTVERERAELLARGMDTSNASKKWLFLERAVPLPTIETRATATGAVADLLTPTPTGEDDRPITLYHILEKGGVNALGQIIPPRPLWSTTLRQDFPRILDRFIRRMNEELGRNL